MTREPMTLGVMLWGYRHARAAVARHRDTHRLRPVPQRRGPGHLPDGWLKVTMNNPRMIIGLSVLLCLYLAFGMMGCASAAVACDYRGCGPFGLDAPDVGVDASETTDDSQRFTLWIWYYPNEWRAETHHDIKEACEAALEHWANHLRGTALELMDQDKDAAKLWPLCLPSGQKPAETTDDSRYYYQLYCSGPTGRGEHGCGYFKTLAECQAAAKADPNTKHAPAHDWCVRGETRMDPIGGHAQRLGGSRALPNEIGVCEGG